MAKPWTPSLISRIFFKGIWSVAISPNGPEIDGLVHRWESLEKFQRRARSFMGAPAHEAG